MKMQRYMKAAAPIRTLLVASLLFMGFIYGISPGSDVTFIAVLLFST